MQLYSAQFVVFLAVALAAYFAVGRFSKKHSWIVLLVASLGFYLATGWQNMFFIVFTAFSTWGVGLAFSKLDAQAKEERAKAEDRAQKKAIKAKFTKRKWAILLAAMVVNFGILAYIKYWNALLDSVGMGDSFMASSLLLPLGLSFYTFQSVGYLIDTYNGKNEAERNFAKYLLFVSWFPQLIQGPINRFDALAQQLYEHHSFDSTNAKRAMMLIGFGMLKKFAIADMLVKTVGVCLDKIVPTTPGSIIVFGILMYSAQQYADFSGGIDMVRGVSQLFGVKMAENFRQPYFSISLGDFWRRWHITLGAWMRDYVFYPFALTKPMQTLGKICSSKLGRHWGRTLPASIANILVFFLVGLWHGAEAHYIWWGLYNGIVIATADLAAPLFEKLIALFKINVETKAWHFFRIVRTFIIVNIGWYFDRIMNFGDCMQGFYNTLFNFAPDRFLATLSSFGLQHFELRSLVALVGCLIVLLVSILKENGVDVKGEILKLNIVVRYAIYLIVLFIVLGSFMVAPTSGGFIYANF